MQLLQRLRAEDAVERSSDSGADASALGVLKSRVERAMRLAEADDNDADAYNEASSSPQTSESSNMYAEDDTWKSSEAFTALAKRVELAIAGSTRDEGVEASSSNVLGGTLDASTFSGSESGPASAPLSAIVDTEPETETEAETSTLSAGPDFEDLEKKLRAALESLANFGAQSPTAPTSSSGVLERGVGQESASGGGASRLARRPRLHRLWQQSLKA